MFWGVFSYMVRCVCLEGPSQLPMPTKGPCLCSQILKLVNVPSSVLKKKLKYA